MKTTKYTNINWIADYIKANPGTTVGADIIRAMKKAQGKEYTHAWGTWYFRRCVWDYGYWERGEDRAWRLTPAGEAKTTR